MTDESSMWSTVASQVDAISTKMKDLLGLDDKLSRIETRMDKFDRFGEKMDLIVSDQELKAKIDESRQKNEGYQNKIQELSNEKYALEKQIWNHDKEMRGKCETITEQSKKIVELEKKTNNSCIIGQIGEENVLQVLQGLKEHWGPGFDFEKTSATPFSGDFLIRIAVRVQGFTKKMFTILVDSKKRNGGVCVPHFQQAIRDADNLGVDAIIIVYAEMGKQAYPRGIAEDEVLNMKFDNFDTKMVKACTLEMLHLALSKLLFDFVPLDVEMLNKLDAKTALLSSEQAWRAMVGIVAPLLRNLNLDDIKKQAAIAQTSMIDLKRQLQRLPDEYKGDHYRLLASVFPEEKKSRPKATEFVLGESVKPLPNVSDSSLIEMKDGEGSGAKRARQDEVE